MMPHTVPNRPTYGLVEPMVARVARLSSRRSISLSWPDAHRAARAFEQLLRRNAALLEARELAEAGFEDARHAGGAAAAFDLPVQRGEVAALPEAVLEVLGFVVRARQQRALAEDDGPGQQRGQQQQAHDDLHRRMLACSTSLTIESSLSIAYLHELAA